jgi:hypothetical protein
MIRSYPTLWDMLRWQAAEKSDFGIVLAFRPASKSFIFVIPRGLQPAGDLLFRLFQQP